MKPPKGRDDATCVVDETSVSEVVVAGVVNEKFCLMPVELNTPVIPGFVNFILPKMVEELLVVEAGSTGFEG